MSAKPKNGLSLDELALLAGISRSQLAMLEKAGAPMPKTRAAVDKWLPSFHAWRAARAKPPGPAPAAGDPELLQHKRELARIRATREKIDLAERQRQLLTRQEVVDYASQAVLTVNRGLDNFVRRLAAELGPTTQGGAPAVEIVAARLLDDLREDFAKGMARTHEG